jgi:hypothetical protein
VLVKASSREMKNLFSKFRVREKKQKPIFLFVTVL